jgi:hypothetical protein
MLPTDEERAKIQEAQLANPDLPLGSAEQFLLSLASITELSARLKLWLFKSDYENMEKVNTKLKNLGHKRMLRLFVFRVTRDCAHLRKWPNR